MDMSVPNGVHTVSLETLNDKKYLKVALKSSPQSRVWSTMPACAMGLIPVLVLTGKTVLLNSSCKIILDGIVIVIFCYT